MKDDKDTKFLRLPQGDMSVVRYERNFTELSCFASDLVGTLERKIKRFIRGLREEISGTMTLKEPTTCAAALRDALIMDKNLSKEVPQLVAGTGSMSGFKRKTPLSSSSQPREVHR